MSSANTHDRASVERVYPRELFEADLAQNAREKATVMHGVIITSQPSEAGDFTLKPAQRHVGENDPLGDTLFLAPFPEESGARPGKRLAYRTFIERIVAAATRAAFKQPIGRREPRLRGFHGG